MNVIIPTSDRIDKLEERILQLELEKKSITNRTIPLKNTSEKFRKFSKDQCNFDVIKKNSEKAMVDQEEEKVTSIIKPFQQPNMDVFENQNIECKKRIAKIDEGIIYSNIF